jgi:Cu/Ag efflux pump CusA
VVTANVQERDLATFVAEAKQAIASQVELPAGTYVTFGGASEARAKAQSELFFNSALAAVGIILLLAIVFGSTRTLLIVLANLPFALVGGVLAVFANGGWLSVGSLVGFVTVFGITTRNTIMLVSHYKRLVTVEGRPWNLETAVRGASERFVPIVMTALVSALGLLPIALGNGDPGKEIEGPMATVILGGLASATVLTLFVLPTIALRFGRFGERKEHKADDVVEGDRVDGIHVVEGDGMDGIRGIRTRVAALVALHDHDHEHHAAEL